MPNESTKELDFKEFQAGATLVRLHKLFTLNFLQDKNNVKSPYYQSVFMECVIELAYLFSLKITKSVTKKIIFADDIVPFNTPHVGRYDDIVSLISFFRNAVCHSEDFRKRKDENTGNYIYSFETSDDYLEGIKKPKYCLYDDDIAAVMGQHILYIKRQLERAYTEFSIKLIELPEFNVYKNFIS